MAVVLPILVAGHTASGGVPVAAADETAASSAPAPAEGPAAATRPRPVPEQPDVQPFARFQNLQLSLPADHVLLVGYHEASFDDALPLTPVGRCIANENRTEVTCPPDQPGPDYLILSSRGRYTNGDTAVDLVMRDESPVISPVSGRVVDVRPYALYGTYPDNRIEIEPAGRPDLRLVLIHVVDVFIRPGDEVVAGQTELAGGPNRFPFPSHIDRYFPDERWPHVHVELKPADTPPRT